MFDVTKKLREKMMYYCSQPIKTVNIRLNKNSEIVENNLAPAQICAGQVASYYINKRVLKEATTFAERAKKFSC